MKQIQFSEIKVGDVIRTNGSIKYINATWTVGTVSCIHNDHICLKDYDFDLSFKQKAINKENNGGGCNGAWWAFNLPDAKYYLEEPRETQEEVILNYNVFASPHNTTYMDSIIDEPKYTKMNRLTNKIKRLFNADKRTLYKAGYITECGDLTPEGKQELDYILWEANEKKLVKLAEEKLAEEKENK